MKCPKHMKVPSSCRECPFPMHSSVYLFDCGIDGARRAFMDEPIVPGDCPLVKAHNAREWRRVMESPVGLADIHLPAEYRDGGTMLLASTALV
jgi:hypothetical protein